jgi:hypothetical protein
MKQVTLIQDSSSDKFVRFTCDKLECDWIPICRTEFLHIFGDPTHIESVTISTTAFKGSQRCITGLYSFEVRKQNVHPMSKLMYHLKCLLGKTTYNYTFFYRFNYSEK